MRNCEYYQELISRSLDDELTVEERKELAVHLASCPSCNQMRQLMADISQMMEEDMEEPPEGLHEDIMAEIRRSEMIKRAKGEEKPGKHFAPKRFTLAKPVRNLLATAACMALVIAAALSLNPASRAEEVVAERDRPAVTANQEGQTAAAALPFPSAEPSSTPVPATTPVPSASPAVGEAGTVVTTPVPKSDEYLNAPGFNQPQHTPVQVQPQQPTETMKPVTKAEETPAPIQTQAPSLPSADVQAPVPVQTAAPTPELTQEPSPAPTEPSVFSGEDVQQKPSSQAQLEEPAGANETAGLEEAKIDSALIDGGEVFKAPPMRLQGMFPALSAVVPEDAGNVPVVKEPLTEGTGTDAAQGSQEAVPSELDLLDCADAENIMLLLMGMLDEQGKAPEEAKLPEGSFEEAYIIRMVVEKIPCELNVQIFDDQVYFSVAEIIIEPAEQHGASSGEPTGSAEGGGNGYGADQLPMAQASPAASPAQDLPETEEFEPVWLLAQCSGKTFTELLNTINTQPS